jgi:lipooligosaccharide transport system permease protein
MSLLLFNWRAGRLVERSLLLYRRTWYVLFTGLVEPVFYLAGIGFGVGSLVGPVHVGGRTIPYAVFVGPALMASAAMNGAIYDSIYNVFYRLRYARTYDAILATPVGASDIAMGEVAWALIRGVIYAAAFLSVMALLGLVTSFWGLLAVLAAALIGFAFAGLGCLVTTFMRGWHDFDLVQLLLLPLFLFSATFYPISVYPPPLQVVVQLSPLTRSVDLLRSLTTGTLGPGIGIDIVFLLAIGIAGLLVSSRRMGRRLLP